MRTTDPPVRSDRFANVFAEFHSSHIKRSLVNGETYVDRPPTLANATMNEHRTGRGRYVERTTEDGTVTIADTYNDDAWIRSDTTVSIAWQT